MAGVSKMIKSVNEKVVCKLCFHPFNTIILKIAIKLKKANVTLLLDVSGMKMHVKLQVVWKKLLASLKRFVSDCKDVPIATCSNDDRCVKIDNECKFKGNL